MHSLLGQPVEVQKERGFIHTLREIRQQPATWLETGERLLAQRDALATHLADARSLVFTGSGSSEFCGDCVAPLLQYELGITTSVVGGGNILAYRQRALPAPRPAVLISLARSGDSPESTGAVLVLLEAEPSMRHVVLTCNAEGRLARSYNEDPRVQVITLDRRTNDRSLVMTSSFTNLVLAARFLGLLHQPDRYRQLCESLHTAGNTLLTTAFDRLTPVATGGFRRAVFLGQGTRLGAARECALKMLEMTSGRVATMHETYLGLRHGPMSYVHPDTLLVCFLSSDPLLRAYETDLLRELDRKQLGRAKLLIGEQVPNELLRPGDTVLELAGQAAIGDENSAILYVVAGQILALLCCLSHGLQPDSPSADGVINRVVERFPLHGLSQ